MSMHPKIEQFEEFTIDPCEGKQHVKATFVRKERGTTLEGYVVREIWTCATCGNEFNIDIRP